MNLDGINILITAGPTREMWDSVRFLTNLSSGKLGYSIAREALKRGASVTIVSGTGEKLEKPGKSINTVSAIDMFEAVKKEFVRCDIFIASAAVCDFRPEKADGKIKKREGTPEIKLLPNPDILKWAGETKAGRVITGFTLEDDCSREAALEKMKEKNCDIMIANTPSNFGKDSRSFLLLSRGESEFFKDVSLAETAYIILEKCLKIKNSY